MAKIGRNDPCPCGSGRKYKRCCEPATHFAMTAWEPSDDGADPHEADYDFDDVRASLRGILRTDPQLADRIGQLLEAGGFHEAEAIARRFELDHPDDHAGTECLALICFAQGLPRAAADHLRRAVAAMDARGEGNYCDGCRARLIDGITTLDPDGPVPAARLPQV
jgi:hypothetical protein